MFKNEQKYEKIVLYQLAVACEQALKLNWEPASMTNEFEYLRLKSWRNAIIYVFPLSSIYVNCWSTMHKKHINWSNWSWPSISQSTKCSVLRKQYLKRSCLKVHTSDHEWPRVTTSDHEWPRMTTSDHEWLRMTTNYHEWFLCLKVIKQ
jgi:hypothetical protein